MCVFALVDSGSGLLQSMDLTHTTRRAPALTYEGSSRKLFLRWGRRQLLTALGMGLISRRAAADGGYDADLDLRNLKLLDLTEGGRRFVLVVPRYLEPDAKLPVVVLLHGLGETTNERMGAYA